MTYAYTVLDKNNQMISLPEFVCSWREAPETLQELLDKVETGVVAFVQTPDLESRIKHIKANAISMGAELFQDFSRQKPQRVSINWVKETG